MLGAARFAASPLGVVPKANGKVRTIHLLSYTCCSKVNTSVNQGISSELVSLWYETLDHLFNNMCVALHFGKPLLLWNVDLGDVFQHCLVG
jgi:hypothetical protein